mgnify:CR=1 FL=1
MSHWSLRSRLKAVANPGNRGTILHLLRHRFPTSNSTSFRSHFGGHFELILNMHTWKLLSRKPMSEKWELNKKHWFCESKSRLAILERAQFPLKSSPGCQLFSDFKLSRNLIDSGIENDLKIDPKNLPWICYSSSGDSQGTPWGPPWVQGLEIDDSGRRFERIFDVWRSKSGSKSTLRASQKLIPSYITELEDVNRCRYLRQLEKHLKLF